MYLKVSVGEKAEGADTGFTFCQYDHKAAVRAGLGSNGERCANRRTFEYHVR